MEPIPRRAWAVLAVASTAVVLTILDSGFVSLGFPLIEDEFSGSNRSTLSWVSSGYFIALAALMLVAGALADRLGRRRVFVGGIGLYALGALIMSLAPSVPVLIGARLVQGAGAAALTPVSLALVLREFPESRRSTAVGSWAVIGGSSGVLAPTVGAVLVDRAGWRSPFLMLVALLAVVAVAALVVLDADELTSEHEPLDLISVPLAIFSVGGFALALTEARRWGLADLRTGAAVAVAVICFPILIRRSARHRGGLVDLQLFRIRSYATGSAASVFTQVGFFAFFFTTPLFFTEGWGYSVLAAGFALALTQSVSALVGLPLGRLADRVGAARVVAVGGLTSAAAFVWLAAVVRTEPNFSIAILPAFVVGGVAMMANGAFTTSLAMRDIDNETLTRASSGYYVTRRLASGMGVVIGSVILGDVAGAAITDRFRLVWLFVATCYAVSGVCALVTREPTPPAGIPRAES